MSGKVVKGFLIGAAFIGAAFIPGLGKIAGVTLKSLFLSQGIGLTVGALAGAFNLGARQGSILQNTSDPQAFLPVAYGKNRLGIHVDDYRVGGSNNKYLYIVGSLCHGSEDGTGIHAIDEIYLDERLAVNAAGTVEGWLNGKLSVTKFLGTDAQDVGALTIAGSTLRTLFPTAWPSTSKGRGIAGLILRLEYDAEVFPGGIPNISAIVRGNKVKDPASLGSAAAYSTNPARCSYDYFVSQRYGCKQATSEVDAAGSFSTMKTYYDTTVDKDSTALTTGALFSCNGWIDTARPWRDNVAQILSSCRGTVVRQGGSWRLVTRRAVTPTSFALSEANLVGDWSFDLPGADQSPNIIKGTYIEPGAQTTVDGVTYAPPYAANPRVWPRPGTSNGYLTADKSHEVAVEANLPMTNDAYTAEQILLVTLKEMRSAKPVAVTATEEALQLQVGDVVPLSHTTPGWASKNFWVMGVFLIPSTKHVRLALLEYDANAYDLDELDTVPTPPDTNLPNPFTVAAPTSLSLTSNNTTAIRTIEGIHQPAIKATWAASTHPYVDYYEVLAKRAADSVYLPYGRVPNGSTEFVISPVTAYESWNVNIVAVNTLGRRSSALSGTITTGGAAPVLRPEGRNLIVNGNGEQGTVGSAAPGWNGGIGQRLTVATDQVKVGSRSLKFTHSSGTESLDTQVVPLIAGRVYRASGWIKHGGTTGGEGAALVVDAAFGQTLTVLERRGDDVGTGSDLVVGIPTGSAVDWTFVQVVFMPDVSDDCILWAAFGMGGNITGSAWFSDVKLEELTADTTIGGKRGYDRIDDDGSIYVPDDQVIQVGIQGVGGASVILKRHRIPFAALKPAESTTTWRFASGAMSRTNGVEANFVGRVVLPPGVRMVEAQLYGLRTDEDFDILTAHLAIDTDGVVDGFIATLVHDTTGWAIATDGMNDIVDGDVTYTLYVAVRGFADFTDARYLYVDIYYEMHTFNEGV